MKNTCSFFIVTFTLTQAQLDWRKVFPNDLLSPNEIPTRNDGNRTHLKIVGGIESVPHSRPYQVALILPVPGGTSFCGGSLITKRTILTAAHCVDRLIGPVEVILGAHNIRKTEASQIRKRTNNVKIHPDWDRSLLRNDVALLILPFEIELNDDIQTVELPSKNSNSDYADQNAIVSGWGRFSDGSRGISPVLREVTIPIIDNFWCNLRYSGVIIDSHICASGTGDKSSCNGDSGGPLVVDGVQVGIVSFGIIFGCEVGWPAVFSRVTFFNGWIRENMVFHEED